MAPASGLLLAAGAENASSSGFVPRARVHAGFQAVAERLWPLVQHHVLEHCELKEPRYSFRCVGHSSGA